METCQRSYQLWHKPVALSGPDDMAHQNGGCIQPLLQFTATLIAYSSVYSMPKNIEGYLKDTDVSATQLIDFVHGAYFPCYGT
jgi:hypothetical protein